MMNKLLVSLFVGSVMIGTAIADDTIDVPVINPDEGRIGEVRRVEDPTEFKVCADPDNMPYSNARQEGFEGAACAIAHKLF